MNPDPFIQSIHDSRRSTILEKFPTLDNNTRIPLIFGRYLLNRPEKFYSREIFNQAIQVYSDFFNKYQDDLLNFIKNESREMNLANRNLSEINLLPIHDIKLPDDKIELINFCDYSILPNYLRLIEGVYRIVINPIVAFVQLEKNNPISYLELNGRLENLNKKFSDFCPFSNIIRNGIAHGGVIYGNNNVTFIDKKGKEEYYLIGQFIKEFDDLLDFCNAMMLAYLTFYYSNHSIFKSDGTLLPSSFLFEEIKEELSAPGWEVRGCIESEIYKKESQLNLYISDSILSQIRFLFYLFGTIKGIYKFTMFFGKEYSRYFFSFSSKYYPKGFAAVNGTKILFLGKEGFDDNSIIMNAIESPLIYHKNNILFRLLGKTVIILNGVKSNISLILENQRVINDGFSMEPRFGQIFRYRLGVTIKVSLVIKPNGKDLETIIRKKFRKLINESIKYGRNLTPIYSIEKYLPVSLIHINVMSEDFRERKLESPGLIPELICTIKHYRKKSEKTVDIDTGIPEIIGDMRIVWNSRSGYPKTKQ
jgi:hypothetical protein